MDKTVSLTEAKSQFSSLVEDAIRGDEITITKHGKPVAKIIKYQQPQLVFGALVGKVPKEWLEIDFDDTSHMAEAWDQWRRNLNEIEL